MAYQGYGQFPGYGGPPGGPGGYPAQQGFPQQDPLAGYFASVAGGDGQINADELQRCLSQAGLCGNYQSFSLETCRIMIAMLDRDMSGKLGFNEFKELWVCVNGWKQHFMANDTDRSGSVEANELMQAFSNMGYRMSPQALNGILKRYSKDGKIYFDDYVTCCVKLRALTDAFRRRDTAQQGFVNFAYDDVSITRTRSTQPVTNALQ
uniref:Sorcin n=1 Tax=Eptatretus burgeri TaxID=7764 RepID=A0A8C4Q973_EPTBU